MGLRSRSDLPAAAGLLAVLPFVHWPVAYADWTRPGSLFPDLASFAAAAAASRAATLAAAAGLILLFWSNGRRLSRALGLAPESRLESASTAFALGALAWGQLFLALGLAGLLREPFLRGLLAAGLLAGIADVVRRPPDLKTLRRELGEAGKPWLGLLAIHLLVLAPYAFIPETYFDSLVYHLGLPSLYLLRGRIGPVPDNAFSGVPSIPSMLYGWALALDAGGRAAHLLNFAFLATACAAILALARRLGVPRAGGPAAILFALAPCVTAAAHKTGVETAWAFFQTAALTAALAAVRGENRRGPWAAAGLLIGGAMCTKNIAWGLPAAALIAVWAAEDRMPWRGVAWATAAAAAMIGPWLIKNAVFYANPIYPFLHEYFQPKAEIMPGWRYLGSGTGLPWSSGVLSGLAAWLKAPLESLRYAKDFEHFANPILLGLLPAGAWLASRRRDLRPLLWFTAAAWLPLSLVTNLPRFFIPVYATSALASAVAVEMGGTLLRAAVFAASFALAAATWLGGLPHEHLQVFTGRRSEADFLAHSGTSYYSAPLYSGARWLDEHAPRDARVLVFGDSRGFQLGRDHLLSTPLQVSVLERWANASADGKALRSRFAAEGVSYILVNHAEIFRQRLALSFTLAGKRALDQFWARDTRKVFQAGPEAAANSSAESAPLLDRWVVVYQVLPEEEAAKPHAADDLFAAYNMNVGR